MASSAGPEIERLIALLAKLPGLGPRSARRAALALLKRREQLLGPLAEALADAAERVRTCSVCGALDSRDPCAICADAERDGAVLCVVEEVGALWAMERDKGLPRPLPRPWRPPLRPRRRRSGVVADRLAGGAGGAAGDR